MSFNKNGSNRPIAKNYLTPEELDTLNRIVTAYLEFAELQALNRKPMYMQDWIAKLDDFLKFPGTGLIENNHHALNLLLENTSISENRKTGEKSPTVHFIDFKHRDNNRFIAVCQFKVRILGTEHHIIPDIVLFLNRFPVVVIECKSPKVKEPTI